MNGTPEIKTGNVDAIHYDLLYCNDRTDKIFRVNLSGLEHDREAGQENLLKSQYKLLESRTITPITTMNPSQLIHKETDNSNYMHTMNESDLFENVYTLEEVLAQKYDEKMVFRLNITPILSEQI